TAPNRTLLEAPAPCLEVFWCFARTRRLEPVSVTGSDALKRPLPCLPFVTLTRNARTLCPALRITTLTVWPLTNGWIVPRTETLPPSSCHRRPPSLRPEATQTRSLAGLGRAFAADTLGAPGTAGRPAAAAGAAASGGPPGAR